MIDSEAGQDLIPTGRQTKRAPLVHSADGTFVRTAEQAALDAEALRLRSRGMSYRQVAAEMGLPQSTAFCMVQRALADIVREPADSVIQLELEKLGNLEQAALRVLEAHHVTVSNGKVIYLGDTPLEDDAPVLNAIDRLVRISESRRKLLGADAAQKIDTTAQVKFVVEGVDTDAV